MSFKGNRYSSSWAHVALCADLTWTTEPPDEFVIANQRLWTLHCHLSQLLRLQADKSSEASEKPTSSRNGGRLSVKDVIPESRLAKYYGNFYYDELREKCYSNTNEDFSSRPYNGNGCTSSDLTECWMLPEVEYWFRKLIEDPESRSIPRRRRQYKMNEEDLYDSERPAGVSSLSARVDSVRRLWISPPSTPRKIRARRRQPRRFNHTPTPTYNLQAVPLICDPTCKFQFDTPQLQWKQYSQNVCPSTTTSSIPRPSVPRCPNYRGTNVSRYTPTSQRPNRSTDKRNATWWPRAQNSPRINNQSVANDTDNVDIPSSSKGITIKEDHEAKTEITDDMKETNHKQEDTIKETELHEAETCKLADIAEDQVTFTDKVTPDIGLIKKRLYSTVLSTQPINLSNIKLPKKPMIPGLLKLNPNIVLPAARLKTISTENKFEELEKEALEQYKASDESIDTKFSDLEKEAVEQYSTSNSNTSCSSGNSAEKSAPKTEAKFCKDKVDSLVIYSNNFPDFNSKQTSSMMNLKNSHTPQRGAKKEQTHRSNKSQRGSKKDHQKAASDTDYEAKDRKGKTVKKNNGNTPLLYSILNTESKTKTLRLDDNKNSKRRIHVIPSKKRHLTVHVSESSDEDERCPAKNRIGDKMKTSAHGGGDLKHLVRKSN